MIDMHCHILDNIDDGSKSLEQSIEMARKAEKLGYNKIFATPHYIADSHVTNRDDIVTRVEKLNEVLKEKEVNITIYCGNEVYFVSEILDILKRNMVCTLGNSRYILIEFPLSGNILNLENVVYSIISEGYIPIIAHPERYQFVNEDISKLNSLIEDGALLQINVASILGYYGKYPKKTIKKLLKNNMVSFIGTDAHNERTIYETYPKALRKIEKIIGDLKLKKILIENSESVLKDISIN